MRHNSLFRKEYLLDVYILILKTKKCLNIGHHGSLTIGTQMKKDVLLSPYKWRCTMNKIKDLEAKIKNIK